MTREDGRCYTRIFSERESCRVTEDDSKEEKSGTLVGSSVKGSRLRKPVPPPVVELLPECLRGMFVKEEYGGVQFRSSAEVVVGFIQVSVRQKRSGL